MRLLADGTEFCLTVVYGPAREAEKNAFLQELNDLSATASRPWAIVGDFNLIYRAADKNNDRLNRRRMGQFRSFLNSAELKEIHLQGRLFTWSSEREHPTLERIDRVFMSPDWEIRFPDCVLQSLASSCSDHAPLLLQTDAACHIRRRFHFQQIWTRYPDFMDVVAASWPCPMVGDSIFQRLEWSFWNTTS